jgi:hypothetical protein
MPAALKVCGGVKNQLFSAFRYCLSLITFIRIWQNCFYLILVSVEILA